MRVWLVRHRVISFCSHSLWLWPTIGMFAAVAVGRAFRALESTGGRGSLLDAASVTTVLGSLASAVFTLIVFVASALLITMQLASAQLTPRVIGLLFKDPFMKMALTVFVFAFTFTLATLLTVKEGAPALSSRVAAWSCVVALAVFLYLVDHVGRSLRPSGTLLRVARKGHRVIASSYPRLLDPSSPATQELPEGASQHAARTVHSNGDGVVMAFDARGLVELGQRHGAMIELVPQVGDFVSAGGALFRVLGGERGPSDAALRSSVALGQERTLEQDPAFAFRIIVDVACKALSPAVNDPTTAVLAIDCVHELLGAIGIRRLDEGRVHDGQGSLRLMYRTPQWPEFVQLAVTEIRHFGADSIQVARRLNAMIESLVALVPQERAALLLEERERLQRLSTRRFSDPGDRAMAHTADQQGVGGVATRGAGEIKPPSATPEGMNSKSTPDVDGRADELSGLRPASATSPAGDGREHHP